MILLGCPASASPPAWLQIRQIVGGRLVNGYCSTDYVLRFVYRTKSFDWHVAGVGPIGVTDVDVLKAPVLPRSVPSSPSPDVGSGAAGGASSSARTPSRASAAGGGPEGLAGGGGNGGAGAQQPIAFAGTPARHHADVTHGGTSSAANSLYTPIASAPPVPPRRRSSFSGVPGGGLGDETPSTTPAAARSLLPPTTPISLPTAVAAATTASSGTAAPTDGTSGSGNGSGNGSGSGSEQHGPAAVRASAAPAAPATPMATASGAAPPRNIRDSIYDDFTSESPSDAGASYASPAVMTARGGHLSGAVTPNPYSMSPHGDTPPTRPAPHGKSALSSSSSSSSSSSATSAASAVAVQPSSAAATTPPRASPQPHEGDVVTTPYGAGVVLEPSCTSPDGITSTLLHMGWGKMYYQPAAGAASSSASSSGARGDGPLSSAAVAAPDGGPVFSSSTPTPVRHRTRSCDAVDGSGRADDCDSAGVGYASASRPALQRGGSAKLAALALAGPGKRMEGRMGRRSLGSDSLFKSPASTVLVLSRPYKRCVYVVDVPLL